MLAQADEGELMILGRADILDYPLDHRLATNRNKRFGICESSIRESTSSASHWNDYL
jgi:hypothetical protein